MKLIRNSNGQGLTEYLMLIVLIAVVSIVATKSLGNTIKEKIQHARQHINSEISFSSSGGGGESPEGKFKEAAKNFISKQFE